MRPLLLATTLIVGMGTASWARPLLLISTENGPEHVQTRIVRGFVERVRACCADGIDIEHHHDAALFRDRDVLSALTDGKVSMAVVGTWQLDRLAPDTGVFMLPVFYGRTAEEARRVHDGPVAARINRQIEERLGAVVLGRWIGLGFAQVFTTKVPLEDAADLKGLRIRSPGGAANAWRLATLGAEPVTIAWTDLPRSLAAGTVDGLVSTFATLDSAGFWRGSVRYALEDNEHYSQYVPLVSELFWRQIDEDTRAALRAAWEAGVEDGRALAAAEQAEARARAVAAGVRIVVPDPRRSAEIRASLTRGQDSVATRVGVGAGLLELVSRAIEDGAAPQGARP